MEHEAQHLKSKTTSNGSALHALAGSAQRVRRDAGELLTALEEATTEVDSFVRDGVVQRPATFLLGAAGIGFILGGGLATRITSLAFGVGSRLAIAVAARQLAAALPLAPAQKERSNP